MSELHKYHNVDMYFIILRCMCTACKEGIDNIDTNQNDVMGPVVLIFDQGIWNIFPVIMLGSSAWQLQLQIICITFQICGTLYFNSMTE